MDKDKDLIIHKSITVGQRNILIMASIASLFPEHKIWLQDVTEAYIQWYDIQQDVYVKPAKKFELPLNTYLKPLKPLYRLSESGDSWFHKYKEFLKEELKLETADCDLSFHYKKDNKVSLKRTIQTM